jgi:hypothetical protein
MQAPSSTSSSSPAAPSTTRPSTAPAPPCTARAPKLLGGGCLIR